MANLNQIIEAAGGASALTQMLDQRERRGFEDFCKRTNPKYHPTDDSVIDRAAWRIWREACAWQREKDADICEAAPIDGALALRDIIRGRASNAQVTSRPSRAID